jgi:hypothetical protein
MAGQTLRMLTGYRVGGCAITVRPCSMACASLYGEFYAGGSFFPHINVQGVWVNSCCGSTSCDHLGTARIVLPGPVGDIEEIVIDGDVLDAENYRVDNGNELVRLDGEAWPTVQNMAVAADAVGAFAVTYLRALKVDGLGALAAGVLACEYASALTGGKCKLPSNVTSIVRQGVSMELSRDLFPGGLTGVREVDLYIQRWNPNHLQAPSVVWSPDLQHARVTTWP